MATRFCSGTAIANACQAEVDRQYARELLVESAEAHLVNLLWEWLPSEHEAGCFLEWCGSNNSAELVIAMSDAFRDIDDAEKGPAALKKARNKWLQAINDYSEWAAEHYLKEQA